MSLREIAEAANGACAGPVPPQTAHGNAHPMCPECGPDAVAFEEAFDPPTVLALLDVAEASKGVCFCGDDTECALGRALARLNDLKPS